MASSQEAITNKEEMKTIQELQQETAEKWNNTVFPSKEDGDSIEHMDIGYKNFFKEIASDQQSAYDLGCEVTMERVREEVNEMWEFLDDSWSDNMANRMSDGRVFLTPEELEKAKSAVISLIKMNLSETLSLTPESDLIAKK